MQANDIEDVDIVLDEIAEQNDQMSQIQDALAQSTMAGGIDDDDLEAELNVRSLLLFLNSPPLFSPVSPRSLGPSRTSVQDAGGVLSLRYFHVL